MSDFVQQHEQDGIDRREAWLFLKESQEEGQIWLTSGAVEIITEPAFLVAYKHVMGSKYEGADIDAERNKKISINVDELYDLLRECDRIQKGANVIYKIWENFEINPLAWQQ